MRNQFKLLLALTTISFLGQGCTKSELLRYEAIDMVYFYKDPYKANNDSFNYSFAIKPDGLQEDTVWLTMRIMGEARDFDRVVNLAPDPDGTTAVLGTHYYLPPYIIPAGAFSANLPVVVKRTPEMKTQSVTILLKVIESADFAPGVPNSPVTGSLAGAGLHYLVRVSDFLVKPSNWDNMLVIFFGSYSQVKYKFIIDVTGKTEFPFGPPPQMSYGELLYYKAFVKMKYQEYEALNGPLIDEFGSPLAFP